MPAHSGTSRSHYIVKVKVKDMGRHEEFGANNMLLQVLLGKPEFPVKYYFKSLIIKSFPIQSIRSH